jgi:hypothetical protein
LGSLLLGLRRSLIKPTNRELISNATIRIITYLCQLSPKWLLTTTQCVHAVALYLEPHSPHDPQEEEVMEEMLAMVYGILEMVCSVHYVGPIHVFEALNSLYGKSEEEQGDEKKKGRFYYIISPLGSSQSTSIQRSCLRILNSVLDSTHEIEERFCMRLEAAALGLTSALPLLPEECASERNQYESDYMQDYQDMLAKFPRDYVTRLFMNTNIACSTSSAGSGRVAEAVVFFPDGVSRVCTVPISEGRTWETYKYDFAFFIFSSFYLFIFSSFHPLLLFFSFSLSFLPPHSPQHFL